MQKRTRTIIMGAAGRDFHNFNTLYRDDISHQIVAFTATQIPKIDDRRYPGELAGMLYPNGIPIHPEEELPALIRNLNVDKVVFSYSDITYVEMGQKGALVNATGAEFVQPNLEATMLPSSKPVVAVCAIRTGCGKSQTTRKVAQHLKEMGKRIAVVRHPMPYGDLVAQAVQKYETMEDLKRHNCTIEEIEEYEPHLSEGNLVFAGVDYERILRAAEKEADVVLWDGGNNDIPFFRPDLHITVFDPHRAGHEKRYYPGEFNALRADVAVINKEDSAKPKDIEKVKRNLQELNPDAVVIDADSEILGKNPELVRGKRVLVVEDGPTLTHGEMKIGAGHVFARRNGAGSIVNPKPYAVGSIRDTYEKYPNTGNVLPAMGYWEDQLKDLEETINNTPCDVVVVGTPIDLAQRIGIEKPSIRVRYNLKEREGSPKLKDILEERFR